MGAKRVCESPAHFAPSSTADIRRLGGKHPGNVHSKSTQTQTKPSIRLAPLAACAAAAAQAACGTSGASAPACLLRAHCGRRAGAPGEGGGGARGTGHYDGRPQCAHTFWRQKTSRLTCFKRSIGAKVKTNDLIGDRSIIHYDGE